MLLSACSAKRPAQPPLTFRTALLQSGGCSFTAAITADYGESDRVLHAGLRIFA